MTCTTTAPTVDEAWADAVALADRLQGGAQLAALDLAGLLDGERATLETSVDYQHRDCPPESAWGQPSPTRVVVTDHRLVVSHPRRGLLSLWHVDVENLQLGRTGSQWHLDLHPVGINPRVRLTGGATPVLAVHVARAVFPATWARISGLLPLLDTAA